MANQQPSCFTIQVEDQNLMRLHTKLSTTTLPDEIDGAGWDYGVPLDEMRRLLHHWNTLFDWRGQEAKLNQVPQYTMDVTVGNDFGASNIHFIHQRSSLESAVPLLFVHGWPGHCFEAKNLLPLLTSQNPEHPSFHVVAPSLPNFGFSSSVQKRGFGLKQYAEVCHKLMLQLGYDVYVTQGGDWGYLVTRTMGHLYPDHCKASHVNMTPMAAPTFSKHPFLFLSSLLGTFSTWDRSALQRSRDYWSEGSGYAVLQSSKPQTVGYALADSPLGLLAWIYEKLHLWTDGYSWTADEILTWVSIYWFSKAGPAASCRIYYEVAHDPQFRDLMLTGCIPKVLYGVAFMPKEVVTSPKAWIVQMGNVVHQTEANKGGHFAAYECPEFIARDVQAMFGKRGGAYRVLSSVGKVGYLE